MRQKAMVWRDFIYHGSFVCDCGADLLADDNTILRDDWLYCKKCGLRVAKIEEIEAPEKIAPGKYGSYIEFQRKRRMS